MQKKENVHGFQTPFFGLEICFDVGNQLSAYRRSRK